MSDIAKPDANGNNVQFDAAYWAHQPPQVQKLQNLSTVTTARRLGAIVLAEQGYVIDVPIMVYGWDPFKIMEARLQYGYSYVPAALQPNVIVAPGVSQAGVTGSGDVGEIKVSLDFDDYPPYMAA